MPALNGALPLWQRDNVALPIAKDLYLNVSGALNILLNKHSGVAKAGLPLPAATAAFLKKHSSHYGRTFHVQPAASTCAWRAALNLNRMS